VPLQGEGKLLILPTLSDFAALLEFEISLTLELYLCRCAIKTMGDLSVRFGFYGGGWDGDLVGAQDEAGEALTISDPTETW
jgi:hypothetical protein